MQGFNIRKAEKLARQAKSTTTPDPHPVCSGEVGVLSCVETSVKGSREGRPPDRTRANRVRRAAPCAWRTQQPEGSGDRVLRDTIIGSRPRQSAYQLELLTT